MNLSGKYVIKSNGVVVTEFENMLTTNGLYVINQFLSGNTKYWADSLAIGALSSSATTVSTLSLQYEVYRYPVIFKSYQTISGSNQLILKATIEPLTQFNAYEVGVFPARVDVTTFNDHKQITDFSELSSGSSTWKINGSPATITSSAVVTPRVGTGMITLPITTSSSTNTASIGALSFDSKRYTDNDNLALLYYTTASTSAASVTVTFGDNSTPQVTWTGSATLPAQPSGSFYSASIDMLTRGASFTDPISTASIQFYGTSGSVALDHLKFYLGDALISDLQLVSRSTSNATPLFTKYYSQPMDIEYYIQVT